MHLHRKTLAAAALVLALVGAAAGGSARAFGAAGGLGHGPVVQMVTVEQRVRGVPGGKVRAILWRIVRRVRAVRPSVRVSGSKRRAPVPQPVGDKSQPALPTARWDLHNRRGWSGFRPPDPLSQRPVWAAIRPDLTAPSSSPKSR
jgi:hypothetical protein